MVCEIQSSKSITNILSLCLQLCNQVIITLANICLGTAAGDTHYVKHTFRGTFKIIISTGSCFVWKHDCKLYLRIKNMIRMIGKSWFLAELVGHFLFILINSQSAQWQKIGVN